MWILNLLLLIFILGILIFIHELGHFLAAKKFKVHIYEFALGMGPRILKRTGKDGVIYSVRAFPIGGFVQMAGEVGEDDKNLKKDAFMCNKKWYQKVIILLAGVTMNFILALVLLFVTSLIWGSSGMNPVVDKVEDGYAFFNAGIKSGDKFISINGKKVSTWDKAQLLLNLKHEGSYEIVILDKNNEQKTYQVNPDKFVLGINSDNKDFVKENKDKIAIVDNVVNSYPAEQAGIKNGDQIVSINGEDVKTWQDVENILKENKDSYKMEVLRDGKKQTMEVKPREFVFGFSIDTTVSHGFFSSLKYAFVKFGAVVESMFMVIVSLFTGKLSLSSLAGPVGIYGVVGQSAQAGIQSIIYLMAFLSINLGFINALPFPAFDGGRVLFLIIEKIKGSPVKPSVENAFHTIGFILLLLLMLYITFQDILKLF